MKKIIKRLLIFQIIGICLSLSGTLLSGCATSPYLKDRRWDAADIFTAKAGGTGIGLKTRVGPINAGLYGWFSEGTRFCDYDYDIIMWGKERQNDPALLDRGKNFFAEPIFPFLRIARSPSYYTLIEVAVGLGPTVRLGFNPGELLDFALGWFGIDIYGDDIEAKKQEEKSP